MVAAAMAVVVMAADTEAVDTTKPIHQLKFRQQGQTRFAPVAQKSLNYNHLKSFLHCVSHKEDKRERGHEKTQKRDFVSILGQKIVCGDCH
jgi:hypothetical protein